MSDLTRADVRVGLVLGKCVYNPPEDADIDAAIATLGVALAAADKNAANCEPELFPAAVRELDSEAQRDYGAEYAAQLADFAKVLRALRDEFLVQKALPLEDRSVRRLSELKHEMRERTNHAHRTLKRRAPVAHRGVAG